MPAPATKGKRDAANPIVIIHASHPPKYVYVYCRAASKENLGLAAQKYRQLIEMHSVRRPAFVKQLVRFLKCYLNCLLLAVRECKARTNPSVTESAKDNETVWRIGLYRLPHTYFIHKKLSKHLRQSQLL